MSTTKTQVVKYIRKGDKGDPAINIVVTGDNVVFTGVAQVERVYVEVYIGEERIKYYDGSGGDDMFSCSVLPNNLFDGKGGWGFTTDSNGYRFIYMLYLSQKASISEEIPFTVTVNGAVYSKKISVKSVFDGATLRGPQAWSDCTVGYNFQAGGPADEWKDVVLYNNNYYSCVKSHTKTAGNYPGSTADVNNGYWKLGDKIELVATKILLATYALVENLGVTAIEMKDSNGNILFQAKDGNVTCNTGNFKNINVQSGNIAGFKISGNGLTNDPFTNDAYVIFRNDAHNCFAGIGGNVLPTSSGLRAVARFENEDNYDWWGLGRNIAMYLSAKNGEYNYAFTGNGNGILNGWIGGYLFSKFTITAANTIYAGYITLKTNNRWVVNATASNSGIALPKLSKVRRALGISSGNFCVRLTIIADYGTSNFYIYGRNKLKDSNNATPWNTTELPALLHWNNGRDDRKELGGGDSIEFLLIYDSSKSGSIDGFSLYYTARMINQQS